MRNSLSLLLLLCLFYWNLCWSKTVDVCVIGGGASGMSAAVFLKDNGYDVVVLEKTDRVGGHVHTQYFTPAQPNAPSWVELGVYAILNTSNANAAGLGNWKVDTVKLANRFVLNGAIVKDVKYTSFSADFNTGTNFGTPAIDITSAQYAQAIQTYFSFFAKYPWLNTADIPDTIPKELLVPFSEFIVSNKLEPLVPTIFYEFVIVFGLGDFSELTTLHALLEASKGNVIGKYFEVYGGFQTLYDSMEIYLSKKNVIKKAKITEIKRYPRHSRKPVEISYHQHKRHKELKCRDIIIAFPPTIENLSFLKLSKQERRLFQGVSTKDYFCFSTNSAGPLASGANFLTNNDPTQPYGIPKFPAVVELLNEGYGPIFGHAFSQKPISTRKMKRIVEKQLSGIPSSLLVNVTSDEFHHHEYAPHFSGHSLRKSPSPLSRLSELQGIDHTFYVGALNTAVPLTCPIWEKSYELVQKYWPPLGDDSDY